MIAPPLPSLPTCDPPRNGSVGGLLGGREAGLADLLGVHVDVVRAQVKRRRADRAHAPLRLGREGLLLVPRIRQLVSRYHIASHRSPFCPMPI